MNMSSVLIDMSRHSVDFTCKLASRMVTRGFNIGSKKSHRRNVSYGSDQGRSYGNFSSEATLQGNVPNYETQP